MRREVPGRMAAARPTERAVLMLGRAAAGSAGGGSSEYLLFEVGGEMFRAQPHPETGERVWSRWPSGEVVPSPYRKGE